MIQNAALMSSEAAAAPSTASRKAGAAPKTSPLPAKHLLLRLILLVELFLPGIHGHRFAIDEHHLDVSARLERISVGNNQVRRFPFGVRAQPIAHSEYLRGAERDRPVCRVLR